jgi:AcrR family transcriptional regulator
MGGKRRTGVRSEVQGQQTREQILDAAEALFAEHGVNGVSLRAIVGQAGANIAAIHYHFGSRERLIEEVMVRYAKRITDEHIGRLADCREGPGRPPLLEQVVAACLAPALHANRRPQDDEISKYNRLRARLAAETTDFARQVIGKCYDDAGQRQIAALSKALPHLSREDLLWRYHIMLSIMIFSAPVANRVEHLSGHAQDFADPNAAINAVVPLFAALFQAPPQKAGVEAWIPGEASQPRIAEPVPARAS